MRVDSAVGDRSGLEGRTAVVTGGSRGIGRAVVLELARRGVRVHAVARDRGALAKLAVESDRISIAAADLADETDLEDLLGRLRTEIPPIDLLVHCAGVITHATTQDARLVDFDRMWGVNLRATYRLTQGLLPSLVERSGDVVFVNSSVTQFPRAQSGQFAATQHALIGFANSLREELNPLGVRVLTVYPGKTATPRQERLHAEAGAAFRPELLLQPEDVAEILVGALMLPKRAEVTEIRIRPARKG